MPHAGSQDGSLQNISSAPQAVQYISILVKVSGQPTIMGETALKMPRPEQGTPVDL